MARFGARIAFVLLLLGLFPGDVAADEGVQLWQGSVYGMTPKQVLSKFPNAKKSDGNSPMADGAVEMAYIPAFKVVRRDFRVRFYFLEGRLSKVMLSLENGDELRGNDGEIIYDALKEALSAKYGAPLTVDEDPGMPYRKLTTWLQSKLNVSLLYWAPSTVNVVYQVTLAAEADKL